MKLGYAGALSICFGVMCMSLVASQQTSPATSDNLRVDVRLVNIYATVIDSTGRYVNGLKNTDFLVEEDGRRQTLTHFEQNQDTPVSLGVLLDTSGSMTAAMPVPHKARFEVSPRPSSVNAK